jgi:2-polyprenyl-3-methyl-5-hydroxy-6-metoxy-1,4-benzoquinol methylase
MTSITQTNENIFREAIEKACGRINASKMVDIGSGDGKHSKRLAALAGADEWWCIDHDPVCLEKAKRRGARIVKADINEPINLPEKMFDLLIANQVIEHVYKTDVLVREAVRILKIGGVGLWCTPNLASWHNVLALVLGYQPFSSQISDEVFLGNPIHPAYRKKIREAQAHLRLFTKRSLSELLEYHGFKVISFEGLGYYPLPQRFAMLMDGIDPIHAAYLLIQVKKV